MAASEAKAALPLHQLVVRVAKFSAGITSGNFHVREGLTADAMAECKVKPTRECTEDGWIRFSPTGAHFAVMTSSAVELFASDAPETPIQTLAIGAEEVNWSPSGKFLVTWSKAGALVIWDAAAGKVIRELTLKEKKDSWPVLQWTPDESFLFHLTSNQITVYVPDCTTKHGTIFEKGVTSFTVAGTGPPFRVATFVPNIKANPGKVAIYTLPNLEHPSATKTFFNADACKILWSPTGNAVLIKSHVEVDTSGENYDGKSALHYLAVDGTSCTVPFGTNPGEVHDAAWSPDGKDFMAIQGRQPAKTLLFNADKCAPIRDFGNGSRNTIRWSPHGRFVCIGGFGNLAGEMEFWDHFQFKLLGRCQDLHGPKSYEWTPDSRSFVTAVLFPRRRVDNGFKIWTYNGELQYQEKLERLAQVEIRPRPGVYPNLPVSPRLKGKDLQTSLSKQLEAKPKAYIPPALRAQGVSAGTTSAMMKRETTGPKKLDEDPEAKAKKKEKEKNRLERKRQQKEADEAKKLAEAEEAKKLEAEAEAARKEAQPKPTDPEDMSEEAISRKLKGLRKKLAQVMKLQELAGTRVLDAAEQAKVTSAKQLEAEIEQLSQALPAVVVHAES